MVSIIIPTYNYVCIQLVAALQAQAAQLKKLGNDSFDYEIIVADDGSTNSETVEKNKAINQLEGCRLIELKENIGRAYVCNLLIEMSRFCYILMIDSDAQVCNPNFLKTYWDNRHQAQCLCGGLSNKGGASPKGYELRSRYEQAAERKRPHLKKDGNPYFQLSTFNIWINKEALGDLRFDTRCTEYGYEDALLGLNLQQRGVTLLHINNPLIHLHADSSESFLLKTEASMRTLYRLEGIMHDYAGTCRAYRLLQRLRLASMAVSVFRFCQPVLRCQLLSARPSLMCFQLYKLGYYASIANKH